MIRQSRIPQLFLIPGVEIKSYFFEKFDPHLIGLHRSPEMNIKIFLWRGYSYLPYKSQESYMYEALRPYFKAIAKPGACAASSAEKGSRTVIKEINEDVPLDTIETGYGFEKRLKDTYFCNQVSTAVSFQGNGFPFNDGAGFIYLDNDGEYVIYDEPLQTAIRTKAATNSYLEKQRNIIGTTKDGKTVAFSFTSHADLKLRAKAKNLLGGFFAGPDYVRDGEIISREAFLREEYIFGDTRHHVSCPYAESGPLIYGEITEAVRNGRAEDVVNCINNQSSITFPISEITFQVLGRDQEIAQKRLEHAYATYPVYRDVIEKPVINVDENWIKYPILRRGCFNHIYTGVYEDHEFGLTPITIIVPGQRKIMTSVGTEAIVSGHDGVSYEEMGEIVRQVGEKYKIVSLMDSCQGRDPSAMVVYDKGKINVVSQDEEASRFISGSDGAPQKKSNTSPQIILGRLS